MEYAGCVMSSGPYVGIYECAASKNVRRISGSSSSEIVYSVSQAVSSIVSEVAGVSGVNNVDKIS